MILGIEDIYGLSGRITIDVETDKEYQPWRGTLVGLGVYCPDKGVFGYIPCDGTNKEKAKISNALSTWQQGAFLIGHNLKYELHWLGVTPEELRGFHIFDSVVAEHLLREEYKKDLASLEARLLKRKSKKRLLEEAAEFGGIKKIRKWPLRLQAEYCQNDCYITYEASKIQSRQLKDEGLDTLMMSQMDYLKEIYEIEHRGITLDVEYLINNGKKAAEIMGIIELKLAEVLQEYGATAPKKLGSAQQVSKLLYQDLGILKPKCPPSLASSPKAAMYTSTCTNKLLLKTLNHPVVPLILAWKSIKILVSYMKSYATLMRPYAGRRAEGVIDDVEIDGPRYQTIHASYNAAGTVTGRLSCSQPNMQQVKAKYVGEEFDPEGKGFGIRPCFVARPGYTLVSIDYKQMEVVVFAGLSRDPKLLEIINSGEDAHELTAAMMGVSRKDAKTINFGVLYGLGIPGLAMLLGRTEEEARDLLGRYLGLFSFVRPYMNSVATKLANQGYLTYWSGRKRRIPNSNLHYRGVNSEVQGGCADVIAVAAVGVGKYLRAKGGNEGIVGIIHDELLVELLDDSGLEDTIAHVRELMSVPQAVGIALQTDYEYGKRWGENIDQSKLEDKELQAQLLEKLSDDLESDED